MYFCLHKGTAGGQLPHEEFVRLAARAGFAGADPDFMFADTHSLEAMRDLYAANGLRLGGWGIPFNFRTGAGLDPEGVARLKRFAHYAAQLGVDSCANHIMPGSERPFMEQWTFLVARLKPLAAILAEHGLRLGLEPVAPHNLRHKFPHAFIFTPWQMLELATDIGPNVGLLVDSIHFYTAGEPMAGLKRIPKEKIVNAHVNDAPAGPVELVDDRGRVLPGEGVIDVAGYLAALRETGYAGPVSVEVFSAALDALPPEEAGQTRAGLSGAVDVMLIAFNKPYGVVSQFTPDGSKNRTLAEFAMPKGVYPLGRLDADSEGLLLLSDEGELNARLLRPEHQHGREYWVQVDRVPTPEAIAQLQHGVMIEGRPTLPCKVRIIDPQPAVPERVPPIRFRKNVPTCWVAMELVEGKNRQVRRMTAAVGFPTLRLMRVRIGGFGLGELGSGLWRELTRDERMAVFAGKKS